MSTNTSGAKERCGTRSIVSAASVLMALVPSVHAAGATTPFVSYEAEAGKLSGGAKVVALKSAPTTRYASPELEASGHAYVALAATGHEVSWTNRTGQPITFINVRASIPDAPTGGGITATLNLYVNGIFRQRLNLNSRQSWIYEGEQYQASDQDPAKGRRERSTTKRSPLSAERRSRPAAAFRCARMPTTPRASTTST